MRLLVLASALLFTAAMAAAQDTNLAVPAPAPQPNQEVTRVRGCLTAGGDQFKLTTDIGARVLDLSVDRDTATPFIAHEVEVHGTAAPDGSFQVQRILDIADHCGHAGQTPVTDMSTITPKPPQ